MASFENFCGRTFCDGSILTNIIKTNYKLQIILSIEYITYTSNSSH